jgi:hypothetical protein
VWKEKHQYGRTFMGTERTTFVIDEDGVITHIFPRVRVDGHTEEVLAALSGAPRQLSLIPEEGTLPAAGTAAAASSPPSQPAEAAGPARPTLKKPGRRSAARPVARPAGQPSRRRPGRRPPVSRARRLRRRRS